MTALSNVRTRLSRHGDPRWARYVAPVVLGVAAAMAFAFMRPDQIFLANTPSGGDMGAHVLLPAYLRDSLIPDGRIMGWSNDWYAGFPALYFYFPLPALTIVLLDVVLPYGVAFKLVTVAGLVAMPYASYYFARSMDFSRTVSLVAGAAGGTFIFMESFSIFGGNTLSTLAGEYSFSWSMALSLVYLGMMVRNTREGRRFSPAAAAVLALTALSHIITTMVVVAASLPLLLRRSGARTLSTTWAAGFGIAAFWAVPLLARVGLTTDMRWFPVRDIEAVFPRELWPVILLAVAGVAWSVTKRKVVGPALALMVLPIVGFYVIQYLDFRKLYNARLLPYWYFTAFLFAGVAVGAAAQSIVRRLRAGEGPKWIAAGGAAALFLIVGGLGIQKAPAWALWNYSGYEGKRTYAFAEDGTRFVQDDHWADYQALMSELSELPPGRVMWEANRDLNRYGTPMALMLTGYWSEGHPSMEGLLFESSLTTPFHFLNASEVSERPSNPIPELQYRGLDFDRAIAHLALYDVAYYVSFTERATEAATDAGLMRLAEPEPFTVFELPESSLVDVGVYEPAVWDGDDDFVAAALEWYDDVDSLDRWLVADGPDDWRHIDDVDSQTRRRLAETGTVSDIVLDDHTISFSTTAVGVPHLVKVSYFPNWTATGAEGPYRAAPSLMIVVPTEEDVVIEFRDTWAETAGKVLSVSTIVGLVALVMVRRRRAARSPG